MSALRREEIDKLSLEDRLELVEDIWDSIRAEADALLLTPAQRDELDRRLAAHEADPSAGEDWDEVLTRLRRKA